MRISYKDIDYLLLSILILLAFFFSNPQSAVGVFIRFTGLSLIVILSFLYNEFGIVSLVSLCTNAIILPIIVQMQSGRSYGLLQLGMVPLHLTMIVEGLFLYNFAFFVMSIIFKMRKKEVGLLNVKFNSSDSNLSIIFNNLIAIIFSIVAFPGGLRLSENAGRFDMLLPGHAWNQLVVVALIFNLKNIKKSRSVQFTYLFCIAWFLLHGERADMAGLFLGLIAYQLIGREKHFFSSKNIFILLGGLLGLVILNFVGYIRINKSIPSIGLIFGSIVTTPTISDIAYLYNVSLDFILHFPKLNGLVFMSNLESAIPFADPMNDFSKLISLTYINPGGEPILSEPILDFGIYGIPIIACIDFAVYRISLYKNNLFKYEYLLLLFTVPRVIWYGRSYVYTSMLFFIPLMYFCNYVLNKALDVKEEI